MLYQLAQWYAGEAKIETLKRDKVEIFEADAEKDLPLRNFTPYRESGKEKNLHACVC